MSLLCAKLINDYYYIPMGALPRRVYLHKLGLTSVEPLNPYFAQWLAARAHTLIGWTDASPDEFSTVRAPLERIRDGAAPPMHLN